MSSANLGSRSLVAIVDTTSMGINENNEYTVMEHDMIPTNVNFNTDWELHENVFKEAYIVFIQKKRCIYSQQNGIQQCTST